MGPDAGRHDALPRLVILYRDGARQFALDAGRGEPALLFVHGNGGDHSVWHAQIAHFSPSRRVVAVDLRGHGNSEADPSGKYAPETFVEDMRATLHELGIGSAVVVGWSVGGSIAAQLAVEHPNLIAGVALVDNNPPGSPAHPEPSLIQGLLRDLEEDFDGRGVRRHVDLFFPEQGEDVECTKRWLYEVARHTAPGAVVAIRKRPAPADPLRWHTAMRQPVLLLQGGASFLGGRAMGEHLASIIPNAQLHVFEGKGHAPFLTAAEEFNRVLEEFVAGLS